MRRSSTSAHVRCLVLVIAVPILVSCGGSGGGGSGGGLANVPTTPPPAPAAGDFQVQNVVRFLPSSGCLKGLDPLAFVNDVSACIDAAAEVTLDGAPFDAARLPDAAVAVVRGSRAQTTGKITVTSIDVQRVVVGAIESVDAAHARFAALGQQIYVSDTTQIYGDGTIADLAVGDPVSVSGFFSPNGEVVATAIDRDADGGGFVLRGILHVQDSGIVEVGGLALDDVWDYGFEGFPANGPVEGDPVVVFFASNFVTEAVQFTGGALGYSPLDIQVLAGVVSSRASPSELVVAGRSVDCAFFHCEDRPEAQIGTLVAVVQAANADRVELLDVATDRVSVTGPVDAVDVQNASLSVLGFPVQLLPATVVVDDTMQAKGIDDIQIGDALSVVGGPVGDLLVAGRVSTHASGASIATRIASYADPDIRVLGQTIHTDATTAIYEDCVGQRDQRWLFDVATDPLIHSLQIGVSRVTADETLATRVDVDTGACDH